MFCTECGKPVAEGNKFCANCGAPIQRITQPTPSAKQQNQPSSAILNNQEDSNDLAQNVFKYVSAGMLAAGIICILANVGGYLSGMTLIKVLFTYMNESENFNSSFIIACVFLLVSHLGVTIFSVIGLIKVLLGGKPSVCCITALTCGILGIASGIIGWNILAELLATVFATIALILISKIKENDELPVCIYFSDDPNQKDPFA